MNCLKNSLNWRQEQEEDEEEASQVEGPISYLSTPLACPSLTRLHFKSETETETLPVSSINISLALPWSLSRLVFLTSPTHEPL